MFVHKIVTVLLICLPVSMATYQNSMFFCGFSGDYCGQSMLDDVNPNIKTIILAFANTLSDGSVIMDESNFPRDLVTNWRKNGKDVVLSVGGQNGHWEVVFSSQAATNNFVESLVSYVTLFKLDGVDLDIQSYLASPRTVANMIIKLKQRLSQGNKKKLLIVSPEDVTIYQGAAVPGPDAPGQPFNYFVPIVQLADDYIDYYQPQAYNNWYDGLAGGSLDYFKDVYLNWRNLQGYSPWGKPIPNFKGVNPKKLRLGLLASTSAGGASYYGQPATIQQFKQFLTTSSYDLNGFMIWDSHWDKLNNFAISNACY